MAKTIDGMVGDYEALKSQTAQDNVVLGGMIGNLGSALTADYETSQQMSDNIQTSQEVCTKQDTEHGKCQYP